MAQASGGQEFWNDLKLALSAWGKAPALPAVSLLLAALIYAPIPLPWNLVVVPLMVISLGWLGTERVWYLRIYRDLPVSANELWKLTRSFILRYFFLGLLLLLPLLLIGFVAGLITADDFGPRPNPLPIGFLISISIGVILSQMALTFVTQALAYSTTQIGTALRMGIAILRAEWPRTAWYAVIPPLVLAAPWLLETQPTPPGATGAVLVLSWVLLNLWFKGATAAFYLRRHDIGDSGAAFEESPEVTETPASGGESPPQP